MKKSFLTILVAACTTVLAMAGIAAVKGSIGQASFPEVVVDASQPVATQATDAQAIGLIDRSAAERVTLRVCDSFDVESIDYFQEASLKAQSIRTASLTSIDQITGSYVQTSKTLSKNTAGDSGNATQIVAGEGENQIVIERFWSNLYTNNYLRVTATVDLAKATISIPAQVVTTDADLGDISLVKASEDGSPLRNEAITGTIAEDGTITLDGFWGLYVDSGDNKDKFVYANYGTTFQRANARMQFVTAKDANTTYGYDIRVVQGDDNTVAITNFANAGMVITATLGGDRTINIPYVPVEVYPWKGYLLQLYPISDFQYDESTGNIQYYNFGISSKPAAADNNTTASWGWWTLLSPGVGALEIYRSGSITLNEGMEFNYPKDYDENFEGEGTEESPYLIKNAANLNALANKVNKTTDPSGKNQPVSVYTGKYFRLEADIDLQSIPFAGIGSDEYHCFNGVFDGNGHTIKNLKQDISSTITFGGLFGWVGSGSVIKNLTVEGIDISSRYYTGGIVAETQGTVSDCKVLNVNITNTASVTGGIAGIVQGKITGSSADNAVIYGLGGFAGGIVGEISGYLNNGEMTYSEISDCHATNSMIVIWTSEDSPTRGGGVAGNVYYANMTGCYFSGVVDGIEEYNYKTAHTIIGGVAGGVYGGKIERSFAVGNFLAGTYLSRVGGVTGLLSGTMSDCYATGAVYGPNTEYAGGLTGEVMLHTDYVTKEQSLSEIKSSFAATQVQANTQQLDLNTQLRELIGTFTKSDNGGTSYTDYVTITDSYFNSDLTNFGATVCGMTTAQLTGAQLPTGLSADLWTVKEGYYPRLTAMAENEAAYASASAIIFAEGSNAKRVRTDATLDAMGKTEFYLVKGTEMVKEGEFCSISGDKLVIGENNGDETMLVSNGAVQYPIYLSIMPNGFKGTGTAEDPFLIQTKDDLIFLSEQTRDKTESLFAGTYFKMTNDIDLQGDPAFIGIAVNRNNVSALRFNGVFDGGGYTIHNMKLNGVVWKTAPADDPEGLGTLDTSTGACVMYQAFIGRLDTNGVLRNINFAADCADERYSNGAMAVADLWGTVENVRNYADLDIYAGYGAGIVARAENNSKIIDCFNAGRIRCGTNFAGGIASSSNGLIQNCANTGDISAVVLSRRQLAPTPTAKTFDNVGGIVGNAGGTSATIGCQLVNVLNTGRIIALTNNAGGIAGQWASKVPSKGAMSYGTVGTRDLPTLGGFAGAYGTNQTIVEGSTGNYFDNQLVGSGTVGTAPSDYVVAANTSLLTSGKQLEGLDAEVWDFAEGLYPVLKSYADEPTLKAARRMIITMPEGSTATNLKGNSTLASAEGMEWTLATGKEYKIEGNTLVAPEKVNEATADTVSVSYSGMLKIIPISTKPDNPLSGEGTEAKPFVINNAKEWNDFSEWMQLMLFDTEGVYVTLAADIDFEGVELKPLSIEATPWKGVFDGADHKVSGYVNEVVNSRQCIFHTVQATGEVRNVTFSGTINAKTGGYIGGVAGNCYGTMDHVTSDVTINATASLNYMAGVAAYAYAGAQFFDCRFTGSITTRGQYMGGIVAVANDADIVFTDCVNEGNLTTTNTSNNAYIGGIAGQAKPTSFNRCINKGNLTGSAKSQGIGGMVGMTNAMAGKKYIFDYCKNEGTITGGGFLGGMTGTSATTVGGTAYIATGCTNSGEIKAISTANINSGTAGLFAVYNAGSTITDCVNTGDVTADKNMYVGGITGHYKANANAANPVTITGCSNSGNITAATNQQAAGISAYVMGFVTITDCSNSGTISSTAVAGGIAASLLGNSNVIRNCYNTGTVTAGHNIGGIVGQSTAKEPVISGSWNAGSIISTIEGAGDGTSVSGTKAGGIAVGGIAGRYNGTLTDCYNLGSVTGAVRTGGIVGLPTKGTSATAKGTQIANVYNAGTVTSTVDAANCGYIIGTTTDADGTTTQIWNTEFNTCTGAYYVTDAGTVTSITSPGTAVTTAQLAGAVEAEIDLGSSFATAPYCLPTVKANESAEAALQSIRAFSGEGADIAPLTPESKLTTSTFKIGNPEGTTWSCDAPVSVTGNDGTFSADFEGTVTLTAGQGDVTRDIIFGAAVGSSAIEGIGMDSSEILSTEWYDLKGIRISEPAARTGQIYIVKVKFTDGTTRTVKVIR